MSFKVTSSEQSYKDLPRMSEEEKAKTGEVESEEKVEPILYIEDDDDA